MMSTALLLGLIWSGLWMAYLYVIMKCFPWEMLHDYPEDVRKASTLPEPTRKQKRNAKIFSGIGSIIIFGALILFGLLRFRAERADFLTLFWFLFIIAMSWNGVDLLVMVSRAHRVSRTAHGNGLASGLHGAPGMADYSRYGKLQQLRRLWSSFQRLPDWLRLYDFNGTALCRG